MNTSKKSNNKSKVVYKLNKKHIDSSINNKGFICAIIILIIIYIMFVFLYKEGQKYKSVNVSNMGVQANPLSDFYTLKELKREDTNLKCSIYIPNTRDEKLNKYIQINIEEYILNLHNLIKNKNLEGYKSTLDISFDTYIGVEEKYISFVFHIFVDNGGAHPNIYIWSVIYDIKGKEIINIDSISQKYPNFLVDISEYSYNELLKNKEIKESKAYDILKEGTAPTRDNFRNLAIDKNNLIIFFEKYQVAPYVLGEFKLEIPMKNIMK